MNTIILLSLFINNLAHSQQKKAPAQNNKDVSGMASLRDPFKRKILRPRAMEKVSNDNLLVDGKATNFPTLENIRLDQIRITGILLGTHRRAVAKTIQGNTLSGETYLLREGMKLGENDSEIKAILPGGIVLVEKIKNIYDQDEYIETVIPISSEI